ncbi:MAG: hypothetical protein NVSMB4_03470 [Acidimicrobiales bacterium]
MTLDQLTQALPVGLACVQNAYNLLDRSAEPLLKLCHAHNITWVPYFPLGSTFPGVPKVTEHPDVIAASTRLKVTPAQVGLAWLLAHAPEVLLIAGTSNLNHLGENIDAGKAQLDEDTIALLDGLAAQAS